MQVFSELQRNSTYKTFVVFVFIFIINSLSSFTPFFPILLGFFLYCGNLITALFFIVLFSVLHNINIWYLMIFYLGWKFFVQKWISNYINFEYQEVVNIFFIYLGLFLYFIFFISVKDLIIFLLFNFSIDVLLVKVFKCKVELLYY
jgi:hypothetical protein